MSAYDLLVVGETQEFGAHTFTAEEIKRFAGAYDPQRFHTDEAEAAKTHFGALCASGWHTAAAMMRLFVGNLQRLTAEALARGEEPPRFGPSPGFDDLKWLKPVYVGDRISFAGTVTEKRASKSRPGWGIASMEMRGVNQNGEPVFRFKAHVFVGLA